MLKYGNDTGLPETYRITLALSVAFLVHTLFMATFPFDVPEHNHHPVTVRVALTPAGSKPTSNSTASGASSSIIAAPFSIESPQAPEAPTTTPVTTAEQPRAVPEPEPEQTSPPQATNRQQPQPQPPEQNTAPAGAQPSAASVAGAKPTPQDDQKEELTLKSEIPSEESSYLSLLVQTIARKAQIPKLDSFEKGQVLSVELELNLMANGALVGAKISNPSGNDGLDRRVYRAALAASPYPEPPNSNARQQRFTVKVRYRF